MQLRRLTSNQIHDPARGSFLVNPRYAGRKVHEGHRTVPVYWSATYLADRQEEQALLVPSVESKYVPHPHAFEFVLTNEKMYRGER